MSNDNNTNLRASHGADNAHFKHVIIIPYVPLQPNINEFLAGYSHPLKSVFFRLAGSTKLAIIYSMWRVQS